jgi:DNA-binding CsgD family transcriptional regulator
MATKAKLKLATVRVSVPKAATLPDSRTLTHVGQGNGEAIADDGHGSLFDKLRRKYPHIDPKALKEHLAKPLELQPLWLASGRSVSMNREERADVIIAHFQMCGMTFKQATSTKPLQRIFLRAIKRQVRLTYKQWQVARLTVDGLDIKPISSQLKISERMVKTHLQAVRRKASLTRNAQIVLWFLGY